MILRLTPLTALVVVAGLCWFTIRPGEPRADRTYVNPGGIHTLDPARMSWTSDFRVALNVWEGLMTWDPRTMKPIPAAAAGAPRVDGDGLIYRFNLRDDARWSNGDSVTAADFVRGWRRGLEPGTATDYTFLLTDHIAGAAEYVRFRRDAVAVLVPLSRLAEGWAITADQARDLLAHPGVASIVRSSDGGVAVPAVSDRQSAWAACAGSLKSAPIDWSAIHERVRREHAAEVDEVFAGVGITARDARTFEVELVAPCPYFLDLCAMPIFLPIHERIERMRIVSGGLPFTREGLVAYDPQWTKPHATAGGYAGLVTNGPYRIEDWTFKRRLRLAVNPYYHGASEIACRVVDMVVHSSIGASIMSYERGAVDFLPSMNVPYDHELARLAATGARPDFHLCDVLATYFLNFNCAGGQVGGLLNPFGDARVRRAFALAVDKRRIVERVLGRGDRIARSFVPPDGIAGYDPPDGLAHDVEAARRLLAAAGYPNGEGLPPIDLLYTPNDSKIMQALARMWEESLGVRVALRGKETRTFAEDKANHRFMIARANWYADYNDPTTFLDCLQTGNGNNDSAYSNPEYDALLAEAASLRDPKLRFARLREAEAVIVERDLPVLPILFYREPIAISPRVKGLYPNPRMWFPFKYVKVAP